MTGKRSGIIPRPGSPSPPRASPSGHDTLASPLSVRISYAVYKHTIPHLLYIHPKLVVVLVWIDGWGEIRPVVFHQVTQFVEQVNSPSKALSEQVDMRFV